MTVLAQMVYNKALVSVIFLAFFAGASGNRCQNKTYIEIYNPSDPLDYKCWPPVVCQDGQEESVLPGSVHPSGTDVECLACPKDKFSNKMTNHHCHGCTSCGNKQELLTCTPDRDRLCSNSCISRDFYFNATDQQCYPCTECCGSNPSNIEPQCVLSMPIIVGITVIGGKGALHCKVKSAQHCDDLLKKFNATPHSSQPSPTERTTYFDAIPESSQPGPTVRKQSRLVLDPVHIALICSLVMSAILFGLVFMWRRNISQSCPCFLSCFRCPLSLSGQRCRAAYEMTPCRMPFQERLKFIPDDLEINSISYEVEEKIKGLDAKRTHCKTWFDVGRKLRVPIDDLELIKREDDREGGSPTTVLLSHLRNCEPVVTLRMFVSVLHDLKRNDIANAILEFFPPQAPNNDSNV